MKKKVLAFIRLDSMIDLITNSSSELFVLENTMAIPTLVELVNTVLEGHCKITEGSVMNRLVKDKEDYNVHYQIDEFLDLIPESDRDDIKEKYFTNPRWYAISFDRDWIYNKSSCGFDVRHALSNIGFELIDTDY